MPKLHELEIIAERNKAVCICVTEKWLNNTFPDSEVSIRNNCILCKDCDKQGGGVCMYIRKDLSFNKKTDLDHDGIEALWIELFLPKSKPVLTGVSYRPPTQQDFYSILDFVFSSSNDFLQYETILLGDLNTDVLCSKSYPVLNHFINMLNLTQVINEPTRICPTSSTAIDLILV